MSRNRLFAGFFFLTLVLLTFISGCGKKDPVVAFVGNNESILLSELKSEMLKGRPESQWSQFTEAEVRAYLEKAIDQRLFIEGALQAGLKNDSDVINAITPQYQKQMLMKLYEDEIFNKVVPEKDVRDFYNHEGKRVGFSDIILQFPPNATELMKDSVKAESFSLYQRLRDGEDFGYLAKQYSQHATSSERDGNVGVVEWSTSKDPIRNELWTLSKGEISKPVANYKGFHILKVDEIITLEKKPYDTEKGRIRNLLNRERRAELETAAKDYWEAVKKERKVVFHEDRLNAWAAWFGGISSICKDVKDSLSALPDEKKSEVLYSFDKGEYTIQFISDRLLTVNDNIELRLQMPAVLNEFFERDMQATFLTEEAEKHGYHKEREMIPVLNQIRTDEMARIFIDREIVGDIAPTNEEARAHYEITKESKYVDEERRKINEIMIKDKSLAERVAQMAKAGQNFEALAEKYTERPNHNKVKGEFAWFTKGRCGVIGEKAYEMKKGQIVGPLYVEKDSAYTIFRLTDIRPKTFRPFDDVERRVLNDYAAALKNQRKSAWLAEARKKIEIRISDREIKNAVGK